MLWVDMWMTVGVTHFGLALNHRWGNVTVGHMLGCLAERLEAWTRRGLAAVGDV